MYLTRPGSTLSQNRQSLLQQGRARSGQIQIHTNSFLKPVDIEFIIKFMITSICRDVETAGVPDPRQMSQVRPNTLEAVLRKWAKCTESLGQPKYQFFITQDWVSSADRRGARCFSSLPGVLVVVLENRTHFSTVR